MDARFNAFHKGAKNSVEFSILAGPSKTKMEIYEDVWRKFILIRFFSAGGVTIGGKGFGCDRGHE